MRPIRASSASSRIDEEVHIDSLSHDGRGLTRYHGKALFVDGALQGETVKVQVVEDRRRFINARVKEVVKASSERCEPACRHFKQCGGCSLQFWSHDGQLAGKQRIVEDQLQRFASLESQEIIEPLVSGAYDYRYRCRLAIRWKKGRLHLGFREKASQAICSVTECPVLAEPLQKLPVQLREVLPELKGREAISHAECFLADNGRGVMLRHIRPLSSDDRQILTDFASQQNLYLYLQSGPGKVECLHAAGSEQWLNYHLPEFDINLEFRPQDFTQVNWPVNKAMINRTLEWLALKPKDKVLDLFCGLGNFSLPMAKQCQHVTGVEGSESSVIRATDNAKMNGIDNTAFYVADLSAEFSHCDWAAQSYDALLLDPPRTGALEVIQRLAELLPQKIVYVSCNPATLARDAGELAKQGYKLQRLSVMDMFPQTAHVESIVLFLR